MKIPVMPFLLSVMFLAVGMFLMIAYPKTWPLCVATAVNFAYAGNREIWHNGKPLVLRYRK